MTVLLATATELPRPDDDDPRLRAALRAQGVQSEARAWDDSSVDWGAARACIIRSTWNYVRHLPAFLAWAERVAAVSALWNPLSIVRWNSHKGYLLELAARGLPVVPTRLVRAGETVDLASLGWPRLVVKPAVSAGSYGTMRVDAATIAAGQAHLDAWAARADMLVQPYLASVEDHGERALVFIDGQLSHAVRKSPRFAADRQNISGAMPVAPDEEELARRVLAAIPGPLLYARVDMVRDGAGQPCLMELELIEPALFLDRTPEAAARLAKAIARRL